MRSIILTNEDVKVHINILEENKIKNATTKVVVEFNYVNNGNPFYDCDNEFSYQDKVKSKIIDILNKYEDFSIIEL